MTYAEFLKTKEDEQIRAGFTVKREDLNENEFPYQKDIVEWALRKGKAAVFSDCGTGKSTWVVIHFTDRWRAVYTSRVSGNTFRAA